MFRSSSKPVQWAPPHPAPAPMGNQAIAGLALSMGGGSVSSRQTGGSRAGPALGGSAGAGTSGHRANGAGGATGGVAGMPEGAGGAARAGGVSAFWRGEAVDDW